MKILVIGSGFIATPVIERLQSEGHELLVYTRTPSVGIDCRQIQGDIFNFEEFLSHTGLRRAARVREQLALCPARMD